MVSLKLTGALLKDSNSELNNLSYNKKNAVASRSIFCEKKAFLQKGMLSF